MGCVKGQKDGPQTKKFLKEMLEEIVLGDSERFNAWAIENYTTAVKELVKLQPKDIGVKHEGEVDHNVIHTIDFGEDT